MKINLLLLAFCPTIYVMGGNIYETHSCNTFEVIHYKNIHELSVRNDSKNVIPSRSEKITYIKGNNIKKYCIIAGSYSIKNNAENLYNSLTSRGYDPTIVKSITSQIYRVICTSYDSIEDAAKNKSSISPNTWILECENLDEVAIQYGKKDRKARLDALKFACSEGIKESAPTFGLDGDDGSGPSKSSLTISEARRQLFFKKKTDSWSTFKEQIQKKNNKEIEKWLLKASKKSSDPLYNYQLAHYYLTGYFDKFIINASNSETNSSFTTINEKKGYKFFKKTDTWYKALFLTKSGSKYYNPQLALKILAEDVKVKDEDLAKFVQGNPHITFDIISLAEDCYQEHYSYNPQKYEKGFVWEKYRYIDRYITCWQAISPNHASAIIALKNRVPSEFVTAGLKEMELGNYSRSMFYLRCAAKSHNTDGYKALVELHKKVLNESYSKYKIKESEWDMLLFWNLSDQVLCDKSFESDFPNLYKQIYEELDKLREKAWDDYDHAKYAKRQRRKQIFAGVLAAVGQGLVYAAQQSYYSAYGQSNHYSYGSNYLLNPTYAIMQTNYQNAMIGSISQADYEAAAKNAQVILNQTYNSFNTQYNAASSLFPTTIDWNNVQKIPITNNYSGYTGSSTEVTNKPIETSFTNTSTSTSTSGCSYCNGKGRVAHESYPPTYGTSDYKVYCSECGQYFMKSTGHSHITCPICHGNH